MKAYLLALAVLLSLLTESVWAASQEEETRFLAAAKAAFEKHDADALMAITCLDRVPDKLKESGKKQYVRDAAQTVADIKLTPPDAKFPDVEWKDSTGVTNRSNLPVTKHLKITFAPGATIDSKIGNVKVKNAVYPVGEKDGKLFLLQPAPVK